MAKQTHISKRAKNMPTSPIRRGVVSKNADVFVHKLNIGQPDLASPKEFMKGVRNFDVTTLAYENTRGNKELLDEWSKLLNESYQLSLTPENFVITSGSSEALTFAFNICCDVDDEILVFSPTYANYTGFATMCGVTLTPITCTFDANFHMPIDTQEIKKYITPKTKAILICNPNNPTGTVFTQDEISTLVTLCTAHNLFLIVDEVYREFVYDKKLPTTTLSLNHPNVVVVDSISKRYSLCGARIGCLISHNLEFMQAAINFAATRVSAPTIEQEATAYMLKNIPNGYLQVAIQEYETRRNVLIENLKNIPNVYANTPEGGFYVLASLPVQDAKDFCHYLEYEFSDNDETVSISPANSFFINSTTPTSCVRIAFVLSTENLKRSVEILGKALKEYSKNN